MDQIKRFRLKPVGGPAATDPLDSRYRYDIYVELDPGEPLHLEAARILVFFDDLDLRTLAEGDLADAASIERAAKRVSHYVITKLRDALATDPAQRSYRFSPTETEIQDLCKVDPSRVLPQEWITVEPRYVLPTQRVFISCGQLTPAEIQLGEEIASIVKDRAGLEGYLAQYQQSLEGLTSNIFNAIRDAAAFIAVMHRRDQLPGRDYRGSVWVEQEVAIASFMVQTLRLSLPARVYVQRGIRREGVRGFLLLNPIEFESHEEVLTDAAAWLPTLREVSMKRPNSASERTHA